MHPFDTRGSHKPPPVSPCVHSYITVLPCGILCECGKLCDSFLMTNLRKTVVSLKRNETNLLLFLQCDPVLPSNPFPEGVVDATVPCTQCFAVKAVYGSQCQLFSSVRALCVTPLLREAPRRQGCEGLSRACAAQREAFVWTGSSGVAL